MKIKLLIPILIFTFLFCACATSSLPLKDNALTSSGHFVLGSVDYVNRIFKIANTYGNRKAFSVIITDVDNYSYELDRNDPANIQRFHKLVSTLVYKIGHVDMEMHYFRNKLNRVPKSLKELMLINKTLPVSKRWSLLSIMNSSYHIQGIDGEYNLKFISFDGYYEAVYNKKGILLNENNDPINMGTYNYAAGIHATFAHSKFDVSPYLTWGNTASSSQKGNVSINKGLYSAHMNYIKDAARVYLYRQNLFGMQKGRVE